MHVGGRGLVMMTGLAVAATAAMGQPCYPDCNTDGKLDILDFACFQNEFALAHASADCNADGRLDILDFTCFQNKFAIGCATPPPALIEAELAGRALSVYPYFDAVDVHNQGAGFSVAIDPSRFPSVAGRSGRLYVAANRVWTLGDSITDVRGAFQSFSFAGTTIQSHTIAVTGSAGLSGASGGGRIGVPYDLILDMDSSGTLTAGDAIDGRGAAGGCYVIADLAALGSMPVAAPLDVAVQSGTVTAGFERERVVYPAAVAGFTSLPVVIISHGNGHNYTWYDYLQQHLASWGYITMAHQNNTPPGIEACSITQLQHTDAFVNQAGTLVPALVGKIDRNRLNWIGHSRGGEGVARAITRLRGGEYVSTAGLTINNIVLGSSIAPTDYLGVFLSNPGTTPYHLLFGAADGDVCGCPHRADRDSFHLYERAAGHRSATYQHGASHNDYNCCGFADGTGPDLIGRPAAQQAAKAAWLPLLKWYDENDAFARELLWRQRENLAAIGVGASLVEDREYKLAPGPDKLVINDFEDANPATSTLGGAVTLTVANVTEGRLFDADLEFTSTATDPMNGMTRAGVADTSSGIVFDYTAAARIATAIPAASKDFTGFTYLSLRACQGTRHPSTVVISGDQTFTVTLRDAAGRSSSINIGAYGGGIEEPYQRTGYGPGAGWQNEFETIRVRLTDFLANASGLDLAGIVSVDLDFGGSSGTPAGRLGLDDMELIR